MENWKDVVGFEGLYQVSDLGRVKSIGRVDFAGRNIKTKILKNINSNGYKQVTLRKDGKQKIKHVHVLMAESFFGHNVSDRKIVVDHINNDRSDNRLGNLQVISSRENTTKDKKRTLKYRGVCKSGNKFRSAIRINGIKKQLGTFESELRASIAYELALLQLDNFKKILA